MRFPALARSALPGLCALTFACSDDSQAPVAPTAAGEAASLDAPALSLYGRGGVGHRCTAPEFHQFDFWLGSWQVPSGNPQVPSASFITSGLDGCAVFEDWHGAGGIRGRSLNAYDPSDGQWHQHWVESYGFFPLRLDGGFAGGQMVMQETYPNPSGDGHIWTDRYTWSSQDADDVTQLIERSIDGGPFSGGPLHYHRTPAPSVPSPLALPFCTRADLSLFQEFDFTVGDWDVSLDGPGRSGEEFTDHHPLRSRVSKDLNGCLYEEQVTGFQGYEARVFTNIRPIDEIWRRTYQDNRGLRVYLTGPRLENGRITLTGTMPVGGGKSDPVRVTFEPQGAGHFVQRWERAAQGGAWGPLLTVTYSRR